MATIAILGGGISGLAAAYFLNKAKMPFVLFEASDVVGGKIKTSKSDYLVEHGPNALQAATPLVDQIIEETGLTPYKIFADARAKKRFVVKQGRLQALPMSPPALLSSSFFSLKSKLGLLKEPLKAPFNAGAEESVASFIKRRLGGEFLDYAADPFVTGIFAGNPHTLSLQHAFPSLYQLEQDHGSIFKGLMAAHKKGKSLVDKRSAAAPRRIFSFTGGMSMLPDGMARAFTDHIKTNSRVLDLTFTANKWRVVVASGQTSDTHFFDAVINTLPLPAFQQLSGALYGDKEMLHRVHYPPVTVLALGFQRDDVDHPLDGFGMLVPHKESSIRILGTIFSSTLFPDRAPENHVLLTTLIGGARKGDFCQLPQELLLDVVLDDLHKLLGVHGNPTFIKQIAWPHAIPQYNLGYGEVKRAIINMEQQHNALFFAGNYRCGISVGDAIKSGFESAQQVIEQLG